MLDRTVHHLDLVGAVCYHCYVFGTFHASIASFSWRSQCHQCKRNYPRNISLQNSSTLHRKALLALGLGIVLSACGFAHQAKAQSSIDALLERSAARQQQEQTHVLPDETAKDEIQTEREENSILKVKPRLSLKPTISISEITVPSFNEKIGMVFYGGMIQ